MKNVLKTFNWNEHDIHVELMNMSKQTENGEVKYHFLVNTVLMTMYHSMCIKHRDMRTVFIYLN